jgi:outer membrane protein
VRQAKEQRSQLLAGVAQTEREVRERAQAAWAAFAGAQAAISSSEMAVAANEGAVMGVIQEQRAGERSVLDILNAQQELLSGEIGLISAQHDAVVAGFQLLASSGAFTARSLELEVKLYDPQVHYNSDASAWFGLGSR